MMTDPKDMDFSEAEPVECRSWTFKARLRANAQSTVDAKRQVRDEHGIPLEDLSASVVHKENHWQKEAHRIIVVVERL